MSPRLRRLSARDLLIAFGRLGFDVVATHGSHAKIRRITPDGFRQTLTIPLHRELAPGTLHAIFRQASRFVSEESLKAVFFSD
jgi:predicted RNA binding protein YcfA (HicA-like mRNA interferase family)